MIATQNNSLYISKPYLQENGYKASATVTFGSNPVDGHNIVLNGTTFTYRASPTVANDVQVGVDISTSIDNLLTEALPSVATYTKVGTDSIFIEYSTIGVVGNSYTISSNFTSVPSSLSGGSDTPDGDWVDNTPTVEYTPKEMYLEPAETTSTALVGYTPVTQGDAVRVHNGTDGLVDGTLGTTTTTGTGTTDTHDIFGDGSAVATYKLDGNANDLGGNYNGTATNVTYGTGKFGQCAVFNGSSSKVTLPAGLGFSSDRTKSVWIKTSSSSNSTIYYFGDLSVNRYYEGLNINEGLSGILTVKERVSTADDFTLSSTSVLNDNQWHNIQVVFSGSTRYLYIDGVLEDSGSNPNGTVNTSAYAGVFGTFRNLGVAFFNGSIDQVRIFNRALTAQEVQTLYTEQATKYTSDITSLELSNPPTKAWLDTPITVATCTESTLNRCIAQDTPLTVTGTPTLTTASGIGTMSGMLQTGDDVKLDGVGVVMSGVVESGVVEGFFEPDGIVNMTYDNVSFSVAGQDSKPYDITFNPDGTKMYMVGTTSDSVYQYTLSTAWNLSTASYDNVSFSVVGQESQPYDITFNSDGTKMYMVGIDNDYVHQYTLSTAWNLSTASYDNVSFSVAGQEPSPSVITFNSDGTKMYMVGGGSDSVYQYTLSTAWNLSTASYDNVSFSVVGQDKTPYGISFNQEGTKMYMVGIANDYVHQYSLSTPWDVNTLSYDNVSFSVAGQDIAPFGITFNSDGTKMYMVGGGSDSVHQYSVNGTINQKDGYQYDLTFPEQPQAPTTLAVPDRSIYPSEASDTYDGTKFIKVYNKVEQQGRAFKYKLTGDSGVEVTKLTIPFNKQP